MGLLTALRLFVAEGDASRHAHWLARLDAVLAAAKGITRAQLSIEGGKDVTVVPTLVVTCDGKPETADRVIKKLIAGEPAIHTDPVWRNHNKIVISPLCLALDQCVEVGKALRIAIG